MILYMSSTQTQEDDERVKNNNAKSTDIFHTMQMQRMVRFYI